MTSCFNYFGILLLGLSLSLSSCSKDDDPPIKNPTQSGGSNSGNTGGSNTSRITAPVFKKTLTTTTTMDVTFMCVFDTGGDSKNNTSCTVYWGKYSKKPTVEPSISDLSTVESMREEPSSSKTSKAFKKSHSGLSGGTWIYYAFECRNSKGRTKTGVMHTIVKR